MRVCVCTERRPLFKPYHKWGKGVTKTSYLPKENKTAGNDESFYMGEKQRANLCSNIQLFPGLTMLQHRKTRFLEAHQ